MAIFIAIYLLIGLAMTFYGRIQDTEKASLMLYLLGTIFMPIIFLIELLFDIKL